MNDLNKKLPQYEPPDTVWQNIETRLMLRALPTYDAPDVVWQGIEKQLLKVEKPVKRLKILRGVNLRKIFNLPKIATTNLPKIATTNLPKIATTNLPKIAIAASVALVVSIGFWFFRTQKTVEQTVVVSTEVVDNQLLKKDFDNEEASFALVEAFCKTATPVCEQPEFKTLKNELDTLNSARAELKNAIGDYAADADLIAELTKIENERTTVLRQLVEKIN